MVEFSLNIEGDMRTAKWIKQLSDKHIVSARASALKTTGNKIKSFQAKKAAKIYNITQKIVRATIGVWRISASVYQVVSKAKKGIPLIKFKAKQAGVKINKFRVNNRNITGLTRRKKKLGLVSVEVIRGQRKILPNAFITKVKSGHVGVFQRKKKSRLPIKQLFSLDPPKMLSSRKILSKTIAFGNKIFLEIFEKQLKRRIR